MIIKIDNEIINFNLARSVFVDNNSIVVWYSGYYGTDILSHHFNTEENALENFKLLTDAIIRDKPFIELKKKEVTNG